MPRETLSLKKKQTSVNKALEGSPSHSEKPKLSPGDGVEQGHLSHEAPVAFDKRHIQSISLLVPARRFSVDFDVTCKVALPAILESALMLIDQLMQISPGELQNFFGLNDNERESLLQDLLDTELVEISEVGLVCPTERMTALRRENQSILLEDVNNHRETFVVDTLTGHIQPRAESSPLRGLPEVHLASRDNEPLDYSSVFQQQFSRFQQCINNRDLQRMSTKLYRVNRCSHDRVTTVPVSLDIYAQQDPLHGLRLEPRIFGFSEKNHSLLSSSGLIGKATQYIDELPKRNMALSLGEYCDLVDDTVLSRYNRDDWFDLEALLKDRRKRKTGYGSERTRLMLGPVYFENNSNLLHWLSHQPKTAKLNKALWVPADTELWGASVKLGPFIQMVNSSLSDHESFLSVLSPAPDKADVSNLFKAYRGRIQNLTGFSKAKPLNNIEILILPGDPGWAMCQYHAYLNPKWGLGGLTVPIGYSTYDPIRVEQLWKIVRNRFPYADSHHNILGQREDTEAVAKLIDTQWGEWNLGGVDKIIT
ncbi:hypothetical protein R5R73_03555 [Salinicola sp. LHM]|uniref:hypothetical protein n=1 Tax=Salinicola sp. LHM TaxID=3065298 RepID=UPI002ACDD1CF|nr:hypothetical protein [Salinicola sp. LHM]WQH33766.1 hypothetical protein R5R73_03555 [Salinicola sp. LHM]